ncbi:MAG: glutamate synthase subunit alpha, partial [Cytophagia bacterium]|nr:glutamate synthase subunit alpha [Cytophagia bacterium]
MTRGLYSEEFEKDACGIGFIANIKNVPSHQIVADALKMLHKMEHRGGVAADDKTGDGAGVHIQIPHNYFQQLAKQEGIELPAKGAYGVGMVFFPMLNTQLFESILNAVLRQLDLEAFWIRWVPTRGEEIGDFAKSNEPYVRQYFIKSTDAISGRELQRKLYLFRKITEYKAKGLDYAKEFYMSSCSIHSIIYKGELRTWQLDEYYPDLKDERLVSAFAIIHSRFSTNTLPEWRLAQPFRYIAHNGEINTIKGNINKMRSREALFSSTHFTKEEINQLLPICNAEFSDSANLDMAVELLIMGGREIERVMAMLIPPAWRENITLSKELRAFYDYHATFLEPWDGPAAVCFTDGNKVGACIDRNGLRPTRYSITKDDRIVFASETGIVEIEPSQVLKRGKLKPGQMILVDLVENTFEEDESIKTRLSQEFDYQKWNHELITHESELARDTTLNFKLETDELLKEQLTFGYSKEDLKYILKPMTTTGSEPIGSMGNDAALAVFAKRNAHLSNYFRQLFAQVSNPAIDPIREKAVMSLAVYLGQSNNLLEDNDPTSRKILLDQPVVKPALLASIKELSGEHYRTVELSATYSPEKTNLKESIKELSKQAADLVRGGVNILVLSNRPKTGELSIPSLLVTGAVHHYLIDQGIRARVSLVIEGGDVIETHHFATLIAYGASAVCPYLAFETLNSISEPDQVKEAIDQYIKAIGYGLRKILSKMGISTLQSYESAQIFEILGLSDEIVKLCFKGTPSRISGK